MMSFVRKLMQEEDKFLHVSAQPNAASELLLGNEVHANCGRIVKREDKWRDNKAMFSSNQAQFYKIIRPWR